MNNRWDREFDERQRDKTRSEKAKLGYMLLAPEVGAYEWWLKGQAIKKHNPEEWNWFYFPEKRYCGQGCYIEY